MRIDVFIHTDARPDHKLDQILQLLQQVITKENILMATLDQTLADVQAETTVVEGLATLTGSLKAQLDAVLAGQLTPAQQAQVDAIFAQVEANKQKLADAITANTPAATP